MKTMNPLERYHYNQIMGIKPKKDTRKFITIEPDNGKLGEWWKKDYNKRREV